MIFPCVGSGAGTWQPTQQFLDQLQDAYPAMDCHAEALRALAWCEANPTKRKTSRGMAAFLNRWMARGQDRGGGNGPLVAGAPAKSVFDVPLTKWDRKP